MGTSLVTSLSSLHLVLNRTLIVLLHLKIILKSFDDLWALMEYLVRLKYTHVLVSADLHIANHFKMLKVKLLFERRHNDFLGT